MSAQLVTLAGDTERLPANHPAQSGAATPMEMVSRALASGASVEMMEKLLALQERWEAGQARKAFDAAISAAKAELPTIAKNKHVGFESRRQGAASTSYKHETLDEIARAVTPVLAKHGLSYRYRASSEPNQPISVTCIVSHRDGHSEETTLVAGRDDSGNNMNSLQRVGSTLTYLQRYTLKAALGLAAADDDDGKAAGPAVETVSEKQIDDLREMIEEVGANLPKFLSFHGIDRLSALPAANFDGAIRLLKQRGERR